MKIEKTSERKPCNTFGCKRTSEMLVNGRIYMCARCAKGFKAQNERKA